MLTESQDEVGGLADIRFVDDRAVKKVNKKWTVPIGHTRSKNGVSDGIRTRDIQNHSPAENSNQLSA